MNNFLLWAFLVVVGGPFVLAIAFGLLHVCAVFLLIVSLAWLKFVSIGLHKLFRIKSKHLEAVSNRLWKRLHEIEFNNRRML